MSAVCSPDILNSRMRRFPSYRSGSPLVCFLSPKVANHMNRACKETQIVAAAFVTARRNCQLHCTAISELQLLRVEGKQAKELNAFAASQREHQGQVGNSYQCMLPHCDHQDVPDWLVPLF